MNRTEQQNIEVIRDQQGRIDYSYYCQRARELRSCCWWQLLFSVRMAERCSSEGVCRRIPA